MQVKTIRAWRSLHTWSSLICTAFLLMLCITGLPLIFHDEIDDLLTDDVRAATAPPGTPRADLDAIVANGMSHAPGEFLHFLIWDDNDPNVVLLSVARALDASPRDNRFVRMDAHTGQFLDAPETSRRLTTILLRLHTDIFAGLPGQLFLGAMGLLFCAAIVSGVVLYAPAMRKHDFGMVRRGRSRLITWLDLHNLIGAMTIVWATVVGVTGVINTGADLVIAYWQRDQLADMIGAYRDETMPQHIASVQQAVQTAQSRLPDMKPAFIAFPGTIFTGRAHFAVYFRGSTPITSRLLQPVLIDARTGAFADTRAMPWYVKTLLMSQPLHFGDYGALPLKIIWAVLDVLTVVVLGSGFYLWVARSKRRRLAGPVTVRPTTAS